MTNPESGDGARAAHGPHAPRRTSDDDVRDVAEAPIREAEASLADELRGFAHLQDAAEATQLQFLRVELEVGNTMLDTADSTRDVTVRARRRARAQDAHDVVARQLAREPELRLTTDERDGIIAGLADLASRLDRVR
jgi:hypothetical protein